MRRGEEAAATHGLWRMAAVVRFAGREKLAAGGEGELAASHVKEREGESAVREVT